MKHQGPPTNPQDVRLQSTSKKGGPTVQCEVLPAAWQILRARCTLTQEELAEKVKAGVTAKIIANWESGRTRPGGARLECLIQALNRNGVGYQVFRDHGVSEEILSRIGIRADFADRPSSNLTLFECRRDLLSWEKEQQYEGPLSIDVIGIDLVCAYEHIMSIINNVANRRVSFRVLMLSSNIKDYRGDVPRSVTAWIRNAGIQLELLRTALYRHQGEASYAIAVKEYAEIPTLHGFWISNPPNRFYVSKCRFAGEVIPNYEWGEGEYRIYDCPDCTLHVPRIVEEFKERFSFLWGKADSAVVDVSCEEAN